MNPFDYNAPRSPMPREPRCSWEKWPDEDKWYSWEEWQANMPQLTTSYQRFRNDSGIGQVQGKLVSSDPWWEADGYREHFRQDDIQATRVFHVPWYARSSFVERMIGYSVSITTVALGAGGAGPPPNRIQRVIPAQHPERSWLYADSVELIKGEGATRDNANVFAYDQYGNILHEPDSEPILDPEGNVIFPGRPGDPIIIPMIEYFNASDNGQGTGLYAVRYSFRDYEVRTDDEVLNRFGGNELSRYVTWDENVAVQSLPIPGNGLKFLAGPDQASTITQVGAGIIMPVTDWTYTWHHVPDVPQAAIRACVGFVNNQPFDGVTSANNGLPFPIGSLLCAAPKIRRVRTATGRVAFEIQYHLLERSNPGGWNSYPASDGSFYPVSRINAAGTATGVSVYASTDLNQLFGVPSPQSYQ